MKGEYRNAVRTKKQIKQAFVELLGESRQLGAISVTRLSQRADIAKSTFYNHYDDVYAVAEEFEDELLQGISAAMEVWEQDPKAGYAEGIESIISFLAKHEEIYRLAIAAPEVRFFIEKLKLVISQKLFEKSRALFLSGDEERQYARVRFLTNACVDTLVDYFKGRLNLSLDQVGEVVLELILKMTKDTPFEADAT